MPANDGIVAFFGATGGSILACLALALKAGYTCSACECRPNASLWPASSLLLLLLLLLLLFLSTGRSPLPSTLGQLSANSPHPLPRSIPLFGQTPDAAPRTRRLPVHHRHPSYHYSGGHPRHSSRSPGPKPSTEVRHYQYQPYPSTHHLRHRPPAHLLPQPAQSHL